MKPGLVAIALTSVCLPAGVSNGAVIFSQNFSSSSTLADYVSSTPDSGQWNSIATVGSGVAVNIVNGALQYDRTGNNTGNFTRNSAFSPAPSALLYGFDLNVSGVTAAATTVATWYVGTGFFANASTPTANDFSARFAINFNTDGTFGFRIIGNPGNNSTSYASGTPVSVTWVVNQTGSVLSYLAPNGQTETVANDSWDLWAGNGLVFNEAAADGNTTALTELKFLFTADTDQGFGSISMDNFSIQAIPEPAEWGLMCALGLLGVCGFHTWRERRRAHGAPGGLYRNSGCFP